jgi:integrase/recombinase XerD
MITLYRRHRKGCQFSSRTERRCRCPIYAEGSVGFEHIRRSLDLTSWEAAQSKVRDWEAAGNIKPAKNETITLTEALDKFLADLQSRGVSWSTYRKYRTLKTGLLDFLEPLAVNELRAVDSDTLRDFRATWKLSPGTALKHLERLRSFFRFCVDSGWIQKNPAKSIKAPKVKIQPRLPFTEREVQLILNAAKTTKERAFLLVLRHTGLRIGDATLLKSSHLQGDRLYLYTAKSGTPVHIALPPELIKLLRSLETKGGYFFLRGESTNAHTVANLWRNTIKRICKAVQVHPPHAHRFRHTLAVDLLTRGASVEEVAAVLGNSPAIVAKHYSQWVKARQDRLDSLLAATWQKPQLVRVK